MRLVLLLSPGKLVASFFVPLICGACNCGDISYPIISLSLSPSHRTYALGVPRSQRRFADGAARGGQDVCRQERGGDRPRNFFGRRGNAFSGALPVHGTVVMVYGVFLPKFFSLLWSLCSYGAIAGCLVEGRGTVGSGGGRRAEVVDGRSGSVTFVCRVFCCCHTCGYSWYCCLRSVSEDGRALPFPYPAR